MYENYADHGFIIRSDSTLVVNTVSRWMYGWKRSGWLKPDGQKPENLDFVIPLYYLWVRLRREIYPLVIEHVPAHSGNFGNTRADQLAKEGAELSVG